MGFDPEHDNARKDPSNTELATSCSRASYLPALALSSLAPGWQQPTVAAKAIGSVQVKIVTLKRSLKKQARYGRSRV